MRCNDELFGDIILSHVHHEINRNLFFDLNNKNWGRRKRVTPEEFKKSVKHRLVDMNWTQEQLCQAVAERTGRYCTRATMSKIFTGKIRSPVLETAIREILNLPEE